MPRLFVAAGRPRSLAILVAVTAVSGLAMLPTIATMGDHGASLTEFEFAATPAASSAILADWGDPGKTAAWWQLALDLPFLVGYGLFLAGACAAVARRAHRVDGSRLERTAKTVAWFGPVAAGADLAQNLSLALILSGHVVQPWPWIAAAGGRVTQVLMVSGLAFAAVGALMTRKRATPATLAGGEPHG